MTYLKIIKQFTFVFMVLFLYTFTVNAQWNIPEDAKNKEIPLEPTYDLVKLGKGLYYTNQGISCVSCHGDPGKGNHNAAINASDLGSADFIAGNTPGDIYYKIEAGMGAMPSFGGIYTEEQIWNIVYFVKSFDENFTITGELEVVDADLRIQHNDENKTIIAEATFKNGQGENMPLEGAEVEFFVQRFFGNLPLADPVMTDETGLATLALTEELPGDENGKLDIVVQFRDQDTYGKVMKTDSVFWGTALIIVDDTKERTLWGGNNRVPVWLLLSYAGVVLTVWFFIFYVIFKITRLKKVGK